MVASIDAIYGLSPVIGSVEISTANANRDGTGALGLLKTGTVNGSRIDFIVMKAIVNTNPGLIRIYIDDGVNIRLWDEAPVGSITASGILRSFRRVVPCFFVLPSGYKLWVSTVNGQAFECFAHGADY